MTRDDSRLLKIGSHKVEVVIDLVEGWWVRPFSGSVPAAEASRAAFWARIVRHVWFLGRFGKLRAGVSMMGSVVIYKNGGRIRSN